MRSATTRFRARNGSSIGSARALGVLRTLRLLLLIVAVPEVADAQPPPIEETLGIGLGKNLGGGA